MGCESPDWTLDLPSLRLTDKVLDACVYPTRQQIAVVLAFVDRSIGGHGETETYQGQKQVAPGQYFSKYHLKTLFNSKGTEAFWR